MKEAIYNPYLPAGSYRTFWLNHQMTQGLNGSMNKHMDYYTTLFTRILKLRVWHLGRPHASKTPLIEPLADTQI
jgi:hypothetical protein